MLQYLLRLAALPYLLLAVVVGMVVYRVSPRFKAGWDKAWAECGLFHTDCGPECDSCWEDTQDRWHKVAHLPRASKHVAHYYWWWNHCRQEREKAGLSV
jgi:hypothetical protein